MGNGMARDGIPMFTDTPFLWTSFIVFLFLALEVLRSRGDSFARLTFSFTFSFVLLCSASEGVTPRDVITSHGVTRGF